MKVRYLLSVLILMCCAAVAVPTGEQSGSAQSALESARKTAVVDGNLAAAIKQYQVIVDRYAKTDRAAVAHALLRMAEAYQKLGDAQARTTYERIVREYSDQVDPVATARGRLAALKGARSPGGTPLGLVCADCADSEASISRDGHWLAVTDWDTGNLAIRDMSTGETRRPLVEAGSFKDSTGFVEDPLLSVDARHIAYVWNLDKTGVPAQLRVVPNQAGAKSRVLIDNPEFEWPSPLAWSSDGTRLLAELQRPDKTYQLAWVSTTNGAVTIVKSLDWRLGVQDAKLSPDGRFIAYSARPTNPARAPSPQEEEVGEWHIYVLAADGRTETEVTRTAGIDKDPIWSPDGTHLLFRSDRLGTVDLWALPISEGKAVGPPFLVRRDIGAVNNLGITNAGMYYFNRLVSGLQQVFVAELDTTGKLPAHVRIVDSFAGMNPSWSPDGKLLEFARSSAPADGLTFNLVVHNMTTGEERLLTRPGLREAPARWLGSSTAFLQLVGRPAAEGYYRSVHSVDLLQGTFREVIPESSSRSGVAAVSPDGTTFYQFARDSQGPAAAPFSRIVAIDLATAQERVVVRLSGPADTLPVAGGLALALSPDGKTLAVATRNPKTNDVRVSRVGTDGTQLREVFGPFKLWQVLADRIAWTKDGQGILFPTAEGRQWKIMRVSAEGGQPEFTGLEVRDLGPFSVSPDGSRIAFSSTSANQSELWALDVSWVWTGKR